MSQRKALVASLVITLVLALSAIGIRAAMGDSPQDTADSAGTLTLVEPGGGFDDDHYESSNDDAFEESDDDDAFQRSDDDDRDEAEDDEDEEDDDDEE